AVVPDPGDALVVQVAEPLGDDHGQRLADDLAGLPAEHPLGPAVPGQQPPHAVGGDDRVHRRLGDGVEPLLEAARASLARRRSTRGPSSSATRAMRSRRPGSPARSWVTNSSSTATTPAPQVTGTAMASRTPARWAAT